MHVPEPDSSGRMPGSVTDLDHQAQAQVAGRQAPSTQTGDGQTLVGRLTPVHWLRIWGLHVLLFLLTLLTTTVFGFTLSASFSSGRPLSEEFVAAGYERLFHGDWSIWSGVSYSIPLLLILLAHELGHYLTCRRWHVDASLPYFGPAPTLLGTVGAFIRIRSPIYSRRSLFDIGVSGPLAGFALLLPFLFAGVLLSREVHRIPVETPFTFGTPLLMRAVEQLRFPGVSASNISLHPMAMAAWAGLLATAMNLLPIGQLDGGHISYALLGERGHRLLSLLLIAAVAVCGFVYWPWWFWAVVMFFLRRHPLIYDQEPLGSQRCTLAGAALLLLLVSICIVPVR